MKVILLQDVAKIGRRFDVVEVPSGYGMNKLIPQGMAKPATTENLKTIQAQSAKTEADRAASDKAFTEIIEALKDTSLKISVDANEEGRMFQALKSDAVATAIKDAIGKEVTASHIVMKTPIKEVGEHTIELTSGDSSVAVSVEIVAG